MKLKDLQPEHVGKWWVWDEEQPYPRPFQYMGIAPEIAPGEGVRHLMSRPEDMYVHNSPMREFSLLESVYGDIELGGGYE